MTKYAVTIICPPGYIHWRGFLDVAKTINQGLMNLGYDSMMRYAPDPNRRNIILGSNLLKHYAVPLSKDSILYNLEQIENGDPTWVNDEFINLHKTYTTWDFCEYNAKAFAKLGVDVAGVLPMGYVDQATNIRHLDKDIDVLFVGGKNERRLHIMNSLAAKGLKVHHAFPAYGIERDYLISRSKVLLNVQAVQPKVLEIVRMVHYLANQCPVVSERGQNFDEYTEYKDAIHFCDYENIVNDTVELCKDDDKRNQLARKGFETFKAIRIEDHLKKVLK